MTVTVLIDHIVRQTTVLIAQLATSAGLRAPLAHVANQVFLSLARELESHGVRQKVAADMFGVALRTYQKRVRRLSAAADDADTSLWQAVLRFLRGRGVTTRAEVLRRFRHDDDATLRGVLLDLVETGLVFRSGSGPSTVYRAAAEDELGALPGQERDETVAAMVWVMVHHHGPISRRELASRTKLGDEDLAAAVERLVADGRVTEAPAADGGDPTLHCSSYLLQYEDPHAWAASVLDHYQAIVGTVVAKLAAGDRTASRGDAVGGSTYTFDVPAGHPLEEEALGLLRATRARASELRAKVAALGPVERPRRVTFYVGQNVQAPADKGAD